jgi:hypothetical protein
VKRAFRAYPTAPTAPAHPRPHDTVCPHPDPLSTYFTSGAADDNPTRLVNLVSRKAAGKQGEGRVRVAGDDDVGRLGEALRRFDRLTGPVSPTAAR